MLDPKLKDYTVFYRVTEERRAIVRATSAKKARHSIELYLDTCLPVPASVRGDTQSVVTRVRDCSVSLETHKPAITEEDLPY